MQMLKQQAASGSSSTAQQPTIPRPSEVYYNKLTPQLREKVRQCYSFNFSLICFSNIYFVVQIGDVMLHVHFGVDFNLRLYLLKIEV